MFYILARTKVELRIRILNKTRMHNMDQKATVIWPGPQMRQILCACPRVFDVFSYIFEVLRDRQLVSKTWLQNDVSCPGL